MTTAMQITAIEKQRRRRRANVHLDGHYAFSLSLELVAQAGLHEGDTLSPQQVDSLRQDDVRHQAHEAALRLLAYRPRSEAEIRQRLARRGLPPQVVRETIARLREQGLLSDAASLAGAFGQRDRAGDRPPGDRCRRRGRCRPARRSEEVPPSPGPGLLRLLPPPGRLPSPSRLPLRHRPRHRRKALARRPATLGPPLGRRYPFRALYFTY